MSAFSNPKKANISSILNDLSNFYQIKSSFKPNVLRNLTQNLKMTYNNVINDNKTNQIRFFNDARGNLMFSELLLPLFNKRYKMMELIASGSFSKIVRVLDTFSDIELVVKILQNDVGILGQREYSFLIYFASLTRRGSKHCK
jgi:hypothetical protein